MAEGDSRITDSVEKIIRIEGDIERLEERVETLKVRVAKLETNAERIVWIILTSVIGAVLSLIFVIK